MSLHRLIYCSRPVDPSMENVSDILAACERNNPGGHITGMLLFTSDHFMQLLEGDRVAVNERFQTISKDTRHTQVELLSFGAIDFRFFDRWSMHYVTQEDPATKSELARYSVNGSFDPSKMSASAVEQLCMDFSIRAQNLMLTDRSAA